MCLFDLHDEDYLLRSDGWIPITSTMGAMKDGLKSIPSEEMHAAKVWASKKCYRSDKIHILH